MPKTEKEEHDMTRDDPPVNTEQLRKVADKLGPECSARLKWLLSTALSDEQDDQAHGHHQDTTRRTEPLRAAPEDEAPNWEE